MTEYTPDSWVILHLNIEGGEEHYRVLAGWSGGYLDGDSWRMNSGITAVEQDGDYYVFKGSSGSQYRCHKDAYGLRMSNGPTYQQLKDRYGDEIMLVDEDTSWFEVDWKIS
jgi:hypothetical protein